MKHKTIKISEELHKQIKQFCNETGVKLNQWCEHWLKHDLEKDTKWWGSKKEQSLTK